jgi:hypothetical protein
VDVAAQRRRACARAQQAHHTGRPAGLRAAWLAAAWCRQWQCAAACLAAGRAPPGGGSASKVNLASRLAPYDRGREVKAADLTERGWVLGACTLSIVRPAQPMTFVPNLTIRPIYYFVRRARARAHISVRAAERFSVKCGQGCPLQRFAKLISRCSVGGYIPLSRWSIWLPRVQTLNSAQASQFKRKSYPST